MADSDRMACALPHPLPTSRAQQALLLLFRRMATCGLNDARAAMLALDQFGSGFLRKLHLTRAFVHGLARYTEGPITIAPCCAPRMTRHEHLIVSAMANACPIALLELGGPQGYAGLRSLALALQAELADQ